MGQTEVDREFDVFVTEQFGRLCRTGYLFCGDWHKAEDAAQKSLLRLHRKWRSVTEPEAYARRALVTILIDESRRPWRRETPFDQLRERPGPDDHVQVEDRDQLNRALARLTPRQRACVVLRFYADASVAQTADALGCSEGNVKRLTSDARHALHDILSPDLIRSQS